MKHRCRSGWMSCSAVLWASRIIDWRGSCIGRRVSWKKTMEKLGLLPLMLGRSNWERLWNIQTCRRRILIGLNTCSAGGVWWMNHLANRVSRCYIKWNVVVTNRRFCSVDKSIWKAEYEPNYIFKQKKKKKKKLRRFCHVESTSTSV